MRVDFAERGDVLSENELLENLRTKAELSVFSPVDVLIALNPDGYANRADAYQELLRRKAEVQELSLTL